MNALHFPGFANVTYVAGTDDAGTVEYAQSADVEVGVRDGWGWLGVRSEDARALVVVYSSLANAPNDILLADVARRLRRRVTFKEKHVKSRATWPAPSRPFVLLGTTEMTVLNHDEVADLVDQIAREERRRT